MAVDQSEVLLAGNSLAFAVLEEEVLAAGVSSAFAVLESKVSGAEDLETGTLFVAIANSTAGSDTSLADDLEVFRAACSNAGSVGGRETLRAVGEADSSDSGGTGGTNVWHANTSAQELTLVASWKRADTVSETSASGTCGSVAVASVLSVTSGASEC